MFEKGQEVVVLAHPNPTEATVVRRSEKKEGRWVVKGPLGTEHHIKEENLRAK